MIIQIENKDYKLIGTNDYMIHMDFINPELPVIYAHSSLSIDELSAYVKQFSKRKPLKSKSELENLEFFTVDLFDLKYPVKTLNQGNSAPFLKNKMIYYSKSYFNIKNRIKLEEKIRETIFEQTIYDLIAKWEERFHVLVNDISFKNLKSSYYLVSNSKLTINKKNIALSLKINDYLLAKALLEFTGNQKGYLEHVEREFSDRKQLEKILLHGN